MAEAATPDKGAERPPRQTREQAMEQIGRERVEDLNKDLDKDAQIEVAPLDDDDEDAADREAEKERKRLEREARKAERAEEAERKEAEPKEPAGDIYTFLDEPDFSKTKARIKVDGRDEEVVIGDALKDVQKLRTASKRLEEASIARKQAEEIKAAAEVEAAEIRRRATEEVASKKESPSAQAGMKEAISLIYEGDQDKGAEALGKAVSEEFERRVKAIRAEMPAGATLDINEVTGRVRLQVAWDYALEQFAADHEDIVSDPDLLEIWQRRLNVAAVDSSTPAEAVRKANDLYASWQAKVSGKSGGAKVTTDDEALAKRAAEKREAATRAVRSSTSLASGAAPREGAAPSVSQVIAAMKKARGQIT